MSTLEITLLAISVLLYLIGLAFIPPLLVDTGGKLSVKDWLKIIFYPISIFIIK